MNSALLFPSAKKSESKIVHTSSQLEISTSIAKAPPKALNAKPAAMEKISSIIIVLSLSEYKIFNIKYDSIINPKLNERINELIRLIIEKNTAAIIAVFRDNFPDASGRFEFTG